MPSTPPHPPDSSAPRPERRQWAFALILTGAVAGALVWLIRANRRPPSPGIETPVAPPEPLPEPSIEMMAPAAPPTAPLRLTLWDDLIIFVVCAVLLIVLPRPYPTILLVALIVIGLVVAIGNRESARLEQGVITALRWLRQHSGLLEIAAIWVALFVAVAPIRDMNPELRIEGDEMSYLLNSGIIASDIYHRSGSIPLWNPFMGSGEPLLESPFSFILNPLMSLPIFALGVANGPKLAVLLHLMILSAGGWALAKRLDLRLPGRILLALLLVGSGGVTGLIGKGFYQMGLSLAYIPWVYVGLLGVLYDRDRRSVAVLVVAATLMIFCGTYWYVLPTAIGGVLITLFALIRRDPATHRRGLNLRGLRLLMWAAVLLLGLGAVRLVPQLVHHNLMYHPREFFDWDPFPFLGMFEQYFKPVTYTHSMDDQAIFYEYTVPLAFAAYLLVLRVLLRRAIPLRKHLGIIIPGLFLMIFFAMWAQGGTPFFFWLYFQFPLLMEWRFESRLMAAGALWLGVIAAIWFDDIVIFAWRRCLVAEKQLQLRAALPQMLAGGLLTLTLAAGSISAVDILYNWQRTSRLVPLYAYDWGPMYYLRVLHPTDFLIVETPGFFRYEPFYANLIRASFGNPDYRPLGLPSTVGDEDLWHFVPEYAWGGVKRNNEFLSDPTEMGYRPLEGSVEHFSDRILWVNDNVPGYAFTISRARATSLASPPLTRDDVTVVTRFNHHIDWIEVGLTDYQPGSLLAIQEVAYPGWRVSINGIEFKPESLGGKLAVFLPNEAVPLKVVFWYDPVWLYRGAGISAVALLIFAIYTLRINRWRLDTLFVSPENAADKS